MRRSKALALALVGGFVAACGNSGDDDSSSKRGGERDYALVVAAGDIVCQPDDEVTDVDCQHEAVADLAESLEPDHVFALGDLQYPHGEAANFETGYDKTWGRFKAITTPVPGNHEYDDGTGAGYYAYWGHDAHPPNGYYSFDIAEFGWHVVALNTNCKSVPCGVDSEQEKWLRADLAANNSQCTIAITHHPLEASGRHGGSGSIKPLIDALEDDGGHLVLSAHDHLYERFAPRNGITHFVVGTGGKSHYAVEELAEGSEFVDTTHFGVIELQLRSGAYSWRFVTIDGEAIDKGEGTCAGSEARVDDA